MQYYTCQARRREQQLNYHLRDTHGIRMKFNLKEKEINSSGFQKPIEQTPSYWNYGPRRKKNEEQEE